MHCGRRRSHVRPADVQLWQSVCENASELVLFSFSIVVMSVVAFAVAIAMAKWDRRATSKYAGEAEYAGNKDHAGRAAKTRVAKGKAHQLR